MFYAIVKHAERHAILTNRAFYHIMLPLRLFHLHRRYLPDIVPGLKSSSESHKISQSCIY